MPTDLVVGTGMDGDDSGNADHFTVDPFPTRRLTAAALPNSSTTVSSFTSVTPPLLAHNSIAASSCNFGGGGESCKGLLSWLSLYCSKVSGSWLRAEMETSFSLTFGMAAIVLQDDL